VQCLVSLSSRPSRRDLLFAGIEAIVALILTQSLGAFATEHSLVNQLTQHGGRSALSLNPNEGRFFVAYALTAVPAAILLARAAARLRPAFGDGAMLSRVKVPVAALALAALAMLLTEGIARVIEHTPLTDDEWVYLFQARCIATGHMSASFPQPQELFTYRFTVFTPDGRLAGVYPPGQPILLSIGQLVGHPHLSQLVCVGGIVYLATRLADELAGAEAAVLTAFLTATSPFLLCAAATHHNSVPTTLFALLAVRGALTMRPVAVGIGVGGTFLCRPFDGTIFGVGCALVMLAGLAVASERKRVIINSAIALACALPFVACYLLTNRALTGDPSLPAYVVYSKFYFGDVKIIGFGRGAFALTHTPDLAFSKLIVAVARTTYWLFGWPLSLAPIALVLFGVPIGKRVGVVLAFAGLLFAGYFLYVSSPVQDIGSIYHLPAMPLFAIVSAVAVLRARDQLGEGSRTWPLRLVWVSAALTLITFWPLQILQLRTVSGAAGRIARAGRELSAQGPVLIFFTGKLQPPHDSWVYFPPLPGPKQDDPALFVLDRGGNHAALAAQFPGRTAYRMSITKDATVEVSRVVSGVSPVH
jgi:hypothetical protein